MSKQKQLKQPGGFPLPEYASVIRWSVNDVILWLKQNKLKDSISCFRLAGVDGNKLLNCTETDLAGIDCPDKEIKMVMNMIQQVDKPGRPFGNASGSRQASQQPRKPGTSWYNKQDGYKRPPQPPKNDSEDDSEGSWGSDFDEDSDVDYLEPDQQPAPPPPVLRGRVPPIPNQTPQNTPGRRKPPPPTPQDEPMEDDQDDYMNPEVPEPPSSRKPLPRPLKHGESEELYDDPDKEVKVQHVHGGPLPPLPGNRAANSITSLTTNSIRTPPTQRQILPTNSFKTPPTQRQILSSNSMRTPPSHRQILPPRSRQQSSSSSSLEDPEEYTDPDQPPPVPSVVPTRSKKHKNTPPLKQQEVYEDPDAPPTVGPAGKQKGRALPPAPVPDAPPEEVYEDPEAESVDSPPAPPVPRSVPKRPSAKQSSTQQLEDYEQPAGRPEPPPNIPKRPQGKAAPPPVNDQEVYEEPDAPSAPAVPTPPRNVPKRGNTKQTPKPPVEQDVYEVPDVEPEAKAPTPTHNRQTGTTHRKPPPKNPAPPPTQHSHRVDRQVPHRKPPPKNPAPPPTQEEDYEEPDAKPATTDAGKTKNAPKPKVNYTQVDIKLDSRSSNPVPTITAPNASPANENLEQQKWYYGDTHRDIIKQRLEQHRTNGMYVIRKSTKSPAEPFTLQIYYDTRVFNLSIRKREDNKYAIGVYKPDERGFSTLIEMINFFKQNFLVLSGGSQTKLLRSLPKES